MDEFYRESTRETLKRLDVSHQGLTSGDADRRRAEHGANELAEAKGKSVFQVFFDQFRDFLVIILLGAAIISGFLGKLESTLVIMVVVIINAVLGTVQHVKAEQSLKSLKALSSPTVKVLRDQVRTEIPSRELVAGDIFYLDAGDYISADGRILETYHLQVNESALTGESESVVKITEPIDQEHVAIGDRRNMVFSGSFATYGRAVAVVTDTGMNTEIGRIANLLEQAKEKKTPLQISLDRFGQKLALIILAISAFVFILDLFRGRDMIDSFTFAVSLAVAAIPEALSSIITIVLALGTQKMAKANAIIRHLHAVENLGSISVICSDKTGTLTQNKMTVQKLFVDDRVIPHDQLDHENELEKRLVLFALLCNDAVTVENREIGDPTEVALVNLGDLYDLDELTIRDDYPRLTELPFDSGRKMMSTVNQCEGRRLMLTKGALDVLLARTARIETSQGITELTADRRNQIETINQTLSQDGLRVLAFAYKSMDESRALAADDEQDLTFLGLIAMMDPPRAESAAAVAACRQAGIKPVMITGDHRTTAASIASMIGILQHPSEVIDGAGLDALSDDELKEQVDRLSVYTRVSPEHKIRIVRAWQEKGHVVAMTGDGVNDAPALKQSDIGIAMGITGTEVAKDSADMVLTDDNFSTIVKAISNGRSIYANIKNAIKFLLSGNTAGLLSVLYATLAALPNPFAPVHLLFINLVTDSLPAIAIGLEPHHNDMMNERPRLKTVSILNRSFAVDVLAEGFLIAVATLTAFYLGLASGQEGAASTMAFATLCLARLLHGFNSRSSESLLKIGIFTNLYLWAAVIIGYLLLMGVLHFRPLMDLFEVVPLTTGQYGIVYGLSFMPLILVQAYKLLLMKRNHSVD